LTRINVPPRPSDERADSASPSRPADVGGNPHDSGKGTIVDVGHLDLSENVQWAMEQDEAFIAVVMALIDRFKLNDWGEVDLERRIANDSNAAGGGEVIGCYPILGSDDPIWIVAWSGHRHTTVMYRSDYSMT
jgi:hypothetical protein